MRKVRLNPSREVASTLKKWFGTVRYTYNWTLSCIHKKPKEYKINYMWLRKRFINEVNIPKDKRWILETPKHVRDGAIMDLVQGYTLNMRKKKETPGFSFEMKYRSKKDAHQSIVIPYDAIKSWNRVGSQGEMGMYPSFLKNKIKFHTRKFSELPQSVKNDCRLVLDRLGRFYLHIPIVREYSVQACESQASKWASIDPGVRTFATIYSPTPGVCFKIGDKSISRIQRLCSFLDKLISKTSCASSKCSQKRMKKAQERMRQRIRHLVDEVHWKTINFLLSKFDHLIVPPFKVSGMVKKGTRKINSKSVRQMLSWRFYEFRMRLKTRAEAVGKLVYERGEEYTSKTCTCCQKIKHNLGGAKIYRCMHCHIHYDRDVGGARNIFLKNASPMALH